MARFVPSRRLSGLLPALLLSACGLSQTDFTVQYNELTCTVLLQCGPADELLFDGLTSVDVCTKRNAYDVTAMGQTCRYHANAAAQCIADLEAQAAATTCGGEGVPPLPNACATVYDRCGDGLADTSDSSDPSGPSGGTQDSDAGGDSDAPEDSAA